MTGMDARPGTRVLVTRAEKRLVEAAIMLANWVHTASPLPALAGRLEAQRRRAAGRFDRALDRVLLEREAAKKGRGKC